MTNAAGAADKRNPVPLLDLHREHEPLHGELVAALAQVCRSGQFILGPEVKRLETSIAELCDVKHAIACASGSDALLLALMAANVGAGDEVILPSFTFFATASAVSRLGAKVVFADIDPETYNVDPAAVERAITPATKAIIPVHLFGQCADMDALGHIAAKRKLCVIEDACQAIGAKHRSRPAGSLGDMACLSFYPTKNLGGMGDGGMLTTQSDELAARLRLLRVHGMEPRYYHQEIGINSRLDAFQAAVLNVKLPHLARWTAARQENAARYATLFDMQKIDRAMTLPVTRPECTHVWNQFTIRVPHGQRDALRAYLASASIGSEVYYPVPLHEQQCYKHLGYGPGSLPHTERAAREVLSLPNFPELTAGEIETVVGSIAQFCAAQQTHRPAKAA